MTTIAPPTLSFCTRLPHFVALEAYPIRSPLAVADFLLPHVRGATMVEIGSRAGDLLKCLGAIADVSSVEEDDDNCKMLRKRGLHTHCFSLNDGTYARLPCARAYYFWMIPDENLELVALIERALARRCAPADVFFAVDTMGPHEDMLKLGPQVRALRQRHNVSVTRLFFEEPADSRFGTYDNPYEGRYGQWGVMHMVHVRQVGSLRSHVRIAHHTHPVE